MKATAKRKLAFTAASSNFWKNKMSLQMSRERKTDRPKRVSKAHMFKKSWMPKLYSFLDFNSKVMPNKKDTILVEGKPKRHLLCSKRELYKKFKQMHPDFKRGLTIFRNMIPNHFNV